MQHMILTHPSHTGKKQSLIITKSGTVLKKIINGLKQSIVLLAQKMYETLRESLFQEPYQLNRIFVK